MEFQKNTNILFKILYVKIINILQQNMDSKRVRTFLNPPFSGILFCLLGLV